MAANSEAGVLADVRSDIEHKIKAANADQPQI